MEKVLTDNAGEKITVSWDGERFALAQTDKTHEAPGLIPRTVIILNPREMLELIEFAGKLGGE